MLEYKAMLNHLVSNKDNTVGSLTTIERSIILGSILGDGYIRIIPNRSDAFLEINHSLKAKDYVDYKYNALQRICVSAPKERESNDGRKAYRFFTKQHPEITDLQKQFYVNNHKVIPRDIVIDPLSLAIWYMDDGSKSRDSDIYLNTQQFSVQDQMILLHKLRELGINARLNKDKKYYRIRILKESIPHFMRIIQPHVVDLMKYKLVMTP
jgi:hypothetical protein